MSRSIFLFILVAAGAGYYFYKSNRFTEIRASIDYMPEGVAITARDQDLHDCKLKLTYDYSVDLPFLRRNARMTIGRNDFKQWNGTVLEEMSALGPEIEFKLRCDEGAMEMKQANRYLKEYKYK